MNFPDWWVYTTPFVDTAFSAIDTRTTGAIVGTTDGLPVPDANRDGSGNVKSVPAGNTTVSIVMQLPPSSAQRKITWDSANGTGNGIAATPTVTNATGVTVNLATRTITYTPSNVLAAGASSPPVLNFAPVSTTDYPVNIQDRPVSDPTGVLTSDFSATVAAANSSSGSIVRFMDWTTVNRNNSPIWLGSGSDPTFQFPNLHFPSSGSEPGTQLQEPIYTAANRNRNKADAQWHDGVPVETLVAAATALGCHAWYNAAPNADNTFYDAVAALWAAFASSTGKDVYLEVGNEPWNNSFTWAHQLHNEGSLLGINGAERYAQKVIEVANRFITAFASAGVSSKLKVVLAWQNYGDTNIWSDMLTFLGTTDAAKITHFAIAPYYGDNSEMGIAASYTGSTATLKAAIKTDIYNTIGRASGHLPQAQAFGKKLIGYEGGNTVNLSDITYKTAWAHSSDAYDLEIHFLQQLELRIAAQQSGGFTHLAYNLCSPLVASDAFSWGLVEAVNQTRSLATTPKMQAHIDYNAGVRKLSDMESSAPLSIGAGAALNAIIGTLKGRINGSTVSISGTTAIGFVDSTTADLQLKVLDAAAFSAATTISFSVVETDARDPLGSHSTSLSVQVLGGTIWNAATSDSDYAITNSGLTAGRVSGGGNKLARANITRTSGYFEIVPTLSGGGQIGLTDAAQSTSDWIGGGTGSIGYAQDGNVYDNGGNLVATYASYTSSDVISVCLKGGKVYFAKNGTWQGSSNPSTGTGGISVSAFLTNAIPGVSTTGTSSFTARFTSGFSYSIPTGVAAWS
jgi:hypothetical protein